MKERIIVVLKRSTWDQLANSPGGFEGLDSSAIRRVRSVHLRHTKSVAKVLETLKTLGFRVSIVNGPEKDFKVPLSTKMVITVGGDGTLLSASHKVPPGTPLLGFNSDPKTSRGYLCASQGVDDLKCILAPRLLTGQIKKVTRLEVVLDGQVLSSRVLNEALFSHACPAAMTKFILGKERFNCSGLWVGTGAGSTGAMRSAGGLEYSPEVRMLQAIVREPYSTVEFPTPHFSGSRFKLISKISEGFLYLDGPFLKFPVKYQQRVDFVVSTEPLSLVLG